MDRFDVIVIGAGVVGLAVAARLSQKYPNLLLIDKNPRFGEETSSRNSEVIHAGLYYPKDSLKARFCVQGKLALYQYCEKMHIRHQRVGKFLVAHNEQEHAALETIQQIAINNDVDDLTWRSTAQLRVIEPELAATSALFSPSTGIIDVHSYMQALLTQTEQQGGMFVANSQMESAIANDHGFTVKIVSGKETISLSTKYLINCGGLHSTKVAQHIEGMPSALIPQLHYCRGHYFSYSGKSPFKHLIYPLPEANGLGIHASLDVGGQLKFGPDTQYIDNLEYSVDEQLKDKFYQAIRRYFPRVEWDKLHPAYSGIRPKLQGVDDDFRDFIVQSEKQHGLKGLVNLFGIDSPGLTSSLAIADYVMQQIDE